jgi:hypothetical protein
MTQTLLGVQAGLLIEFTYSDEVLNDFRPNVSQRLIGGTPRPYTALTFP